MILPEPSDATELEQQSAAALAAFVHRRIEEGTAPYREAFEQARPLVRELFQRTDNLRALTAEVIQQSPSLIHAARYLDGPPLSQDDLDTLSGGKVSNRRRVDRELAERVVTALRAFLDPFRCPWLSSGTKPTRPKVPAAVDWTTSLWAVERCKTARRGESSASQEATVGELLLDCGFTEESRRRKIQSLDELPRGHFTRETILSGAKADFALRLSDGRLLAVECKVSNSALNSVKRLNRETAGKAERWRTVYGQQVITAAVLAGVFKVANLIDAQNAGVFIFWEHDLEPLSEFLRGTQS